MNKMSLHATLAGLMLVSAIACTKSKDDSSPAPAAQPTPVESNTTETSPEKTEAPLSMMEADALMETVGYRFQIRLLERTQKDGTVRQVAAWDQNFMREKSAEAAQKGAKISLEDRVMVLQKYILAGEAHLTTLEAKDAKPEGDVKSEGKSDDQASSDNDRVNSDGEVWGPDYNADAQVLNARLETARKTVAGLEAKIAKNQKAKDSQKGSEGEKKEDSSADSKENSTPAEPKTDGSAA